MKPLRVLLADDHALVRAGIRSLLDRMVDVEVVGEAGDGQQALDMVDALRPDILVIDIAMSGLNGLEAAAVMKKSFPAVKVMILSMHANEEYVIRAFNAGAAAYLVKDAAAGELTLAIAAVGRGDVYLSPAVSRMVVSDYVGGAGRMARGKALTPRQREILRHLAGGRSTKQIAAQLGISGKTVDTHRAQLMQRLGIHDLPGLVRYAIRTGLIPSES
jgi:DNA-binding NarL/FixJ family response regulator